MIGRFVRLYRQICERKNPWRRNRDRHVPLRVPEYDLPEQTRRGMPEGEGWLDYVVCPPQRDLVLQFCYAYPGAKPFIGIPAELPKWRGMGEVYWRMTGIARAQLEARRHRLPMDLEPSRPWAGGGSALAGGVSARVSARMLRLC